MASVTNTYARAFADAVFGVRVDPDKTLQEVKAITELVTASTELREVWETPSINAEQKRAVLDAIVARQGTSQIVRNFIAVLIDHRRIGLLGPIVKHFEQELNQRMGFTEAEITSAHELSPADRGTLEARVEKVTGKKVRARYALDAALLGGAVVRVGSTIYDGSVKGQLERIKQQLTTG
jgi:F-type H+-transporting ATPase subunit delta